MLTQLQPAYCPGDTLDIQFRIELQPNAAISTIETRVGWRTIGKGDEDQGVHFLDRQKFASDDDGREVVFRLSTPLPNSPLTHRGFMIQIEWNVDLRVTLRDGTVVAERFPFALQPTGA